MLARTPTLTFLRVLACFFLRTALARFYGLQERGQRFYTNTEKEDLFQTTMKFCQRYLSLAKSAIRTEWTCQNKDNSNDMWHTLINTNACMHACTCTNSIHDTYNSSSRLGLAKTFAVFVRSCTNLWLFGKHFCLYRYAAKCNTDVGDMFQHVSIQCFMIYI